MCLMEEKNKYVLVNIKEKYLRKLLLLSSRLCFIRMKVLAPQFSEKTNSLVQRYSYLFSWMRLRK